MRRGPGLAGLKRQQQQQKQIETLGDELESDSLEKTKEQLEQLRGKLSDFAEKHKEKINSNPQFRQAFCEMCLAAGVDPLASSKGLWNQMLGIGSFYDELAVQIVTVCLKTREMNGGLLDLRECLELVKKTRAGKQTVGLEDLEQAIRSLSALGRGVAIKNLGGRRLVVSVPDELSADPSQALEIAATNGGRTSVADLRQRLGWTEERAQAAATHFVREGLCWVDDQDPSGGTWYWFPSIALAAIESGAMRDVGHTFSPPARGGEADDAPIQSIDSFLK